MTCFAEFQTQPHANAVIRKANNLKFTKFCVYIQGLKSKGNKHAMREDPQEQDNLLVYSEQLLGITAVSLCNKTTQLGM